MSSPPRPTPRLESLGRMFVVLSPLLLVGLALVAVLLYVLYAWTEVVEQGDQANLREWLNESRIHRKTLPQLAEEFLALQADPAAGSTTGELARVKAREIEAQLLALAEPTRIYPDQLPLFPHIYQIQIRCYPEGFQADREPILLEWESGLPRPQPQMHSQVRALEYPLLGEDDPRAWVRCEYRLHVFSRLEEAEQTSRRLSWIFGGILFVATLLAGFGVYRLLVRELRVATELEHSQRTALEADLQLNETNRELLRQQLAAEQARARASEAERATLELKSRLYASIGILAGSYAHNIKNLLVRPSDLLNRCLHETNLSPDHTHRLTEVRDTLGTVTERLQQILRTVNRDPQVRQWSSFDLNQLLRELLTTWKEMAQEKWQLTITLDLCPGPLLIAGDRSHLLQAIENLLFNARDATFEMRNYQREQARQRGQDNSAERRKALIAAAQWQGHVDLRTVIQNEHAILEVRDNGIGMAAEVRARCLDSHFSTKRDNALYEGYVAGMGLGLSFVAAILEQHHAELAIDTAPQAGATFRLRFPLGSVVQEAQE